MQVRNNPLGQERAGIPVFCGKVVFRAGYPQYCVDNLPEMWITCGKYCVLWIFYVDKQVWKVDKPEVSVE